MAEETKHRSFGSNGRAPWYNDGPKPFVIGVTGGSASGKTSVCEAIVSHLSVPWVGLLSMDRYYNINDEERRLAAQGLYNFDHPDAFDIDRLNDDITQLKAGKAVDVPIYDFRTHSRVEQTDRMYGVDIVIVEGILLFYSPKIRELLDLKIYVDTDNDLRLARRIRRDIVERGRSVDSVLDQYQRTVKPSFEQFIQPTKRFSDLIVPWNDRNQVAIDLLTQHIRSKLDERQKVQVQNSLPYFQHAKQTPAKDLSHTQAATAYVEPLPDVDDKKSFTTPQNSAVLINSPSLQPETVLAPTLPKASLPVSMTPDEASRRMSLTSTPLRTAVRATNLPPVMDLNSTEPAPSTPTIAIPPNLVETPSIVTPNGSLVAKYTDGFAQFPVIPRPPTVIDNATAMHDQATIQHLKSLYEDAHVNHEDFSSLPKNNQLQAKRTTVLYPKDFPHNLLVLPPSKSLTAIHTTIRDKDTDINDFRFAMSRLVRLLCSQAMNLVTYIPKTVTTPTQASFDGLHCQSEKVVAVSIVRAGEAFEKSVREVIKDIAIGKVVIQHDSENKAVGPRLYYAKLPIVNNPNTKILLFDGVLATGSAVIMAIHVLLDHGAKPENIIFCCATAAPEGIYNVSSIFPTVKIVCSALEQGLDDSLFTKPGIGYIGCRYFGSYPAYITNHPNKAVEGAQSDTAQ